MDFVKIINKHINDYSYVSSVLLNSFTKYIIKMLDLFGLIFSNDNSSNGDDKI